MIHTINKDLDHYKGKPTVYNIFRSDGFFPSIIPEHVSHAVLYQIKFFENEHDPFLRVHQQLINRLHELINDTLDSKKITLFHISTMSTEK